MPSDLANKAIEIAVSQIGQTEKPLGSNWGHPVQDYLASVGINFPASWCMAFVYWCFNEAAKSLQIENPLIKTGGVLAQWDAMYPSHRVTGDPEPGDVFIMDFGKGLGHTGIIESIDAYEVLHTIEGNTNLNGSREGIEVDRKTRAQHNPIIGYLRY
jgi:hypothetical protein